MGRRGRHESGRLTVERIRAGWERWLAVTGLAYAILHFIYFAVANVIDPDPGGTVDSTASAFIQCPTQATLGGTLQQAVALVLLLFALSLRAYLRPGRRWAEDALLADPGSRRLMKVN